MDAAFTPAELALATGGIWLCPPSPDSKFTLTTDTRTENSGKIFFALSGERFDAHDFLPQAAASGCTAFCVNTTKTDRVPEGFPLLAVADTLKAFQACAAFHRRRFHDLTVLGVTGSVGKTSVKEILRAICTGIAGEDSVLYTIGNTNNQIGVAQNLLRLTDRHRYAILEAGTSSPGEIAPLAAVIAPDGAIVNSIAPCHLENLHDLDGVAAEKSALLQSVSPAGTAVFPTDCAGEKILRSAAAHTGIYRFGSDKRSDYYAEYLDGSLENSRIKLHFPGRETFEITWPLSGAHNALNAAGAAALAHRCCGFAPERIAQSIPLTRLPGMRMKRTEINQVTYFNDAYNANPASMRASLELLSRTPLPGNLILVLGGMRELGAEERAAHLEVLALQKRLLPRALVMTIGKEFAGISPNHFDDPENAAAALQKLVHPGDTVFAKGSRGNAVEKILPPEAR
jgi:UDP-N-acetylmuramoyl-tripeptide--D-alanyl-D-alanine ligase